MKDKIQLSRYKDLGKTLVAKAQQSEVEASEKLMVDSVRAIVSDVNKSKDQIEVLEKKIELQQRRLKAIEDGEFTMSYSVEWNAPQITFNDPELRERL